MLAFLGYKSPARKRIGGQPVASQSDVWDSTMPSSLLVTNTQRNSDAAETYLRQSALRLVRLCRKRFCIDGEADSLRITCDIGAAHVIGFLTEYAASIRQTGLTSAKALPAPSPSSLRTFLWVRPAADAVLNDAVRLSLYSDQIVIVDPFSTFIRTGPFTPGPMGPQNRPEAWGKQFGDWALMICALEAWFDSGLVVLIPAPESFLRTPPPFWLMGIDAVRRGLLSAEVTAAAAEDALETLALEGRNEGDVAALLSLAMPQLTSDDRIEVLAALGQYRANNPTRYTPPSFKREQITSQGTGQNVFEAAWIADQIGAYLVPRGASDRMIFRQFSRGSQSVDSTDALATAFAGADLPMLNNVALSNALELRRSGRLAGFRSFLHEIWAASSDPDVDPKAVERDRRFLDRIRTEYGQAKDEWRSIYKDLGVKGAVGLMTSGTAAQVIHGALVPLGVGALGWVYRNWSTAARALRRRPSGLLVELENESNPNPLRRVLARVERRL